MSLMKNQLLRFWISFSLPNWIEGGLTLYLLLKLPPLNKIVALIHSLKSHFTEVHSVLSL